MGSSTLADTRVRTGGRSVASIYSGQRGPDGRIHFTPAPPASDTDVAIDPRLVQWLHSLLEDGGADTQIIRGQQTRAAVQIVGRADKIVRGCVLGRGAARQLARLHGVIWIDDGTLVSLRYYTRADAFRSAVRELGSS